MGILPRKSSSLGPGALLGRLALSGRDRLYRPRVACSCPSRRAPDLGCRGACPHAQARAQEYAAGDRPPLHPEIAAGDRPPLQLRSLDSIALVALKHVLERSENNSTNAAGTLTFRLTSHCPSVFFVRIT